MDPYLTLKVVFIATFSLLKHSTSVYLTFIQRNSHYDIMATSVSLFNCYILRINRNCIVLWQKSLYV